MKRIVLDTNCLIASLSHTSRSYSVWRGLHDGRFILCVSNEILLEYQEMIGRKTTPAIAENVVQYITNSDFVELVTPYFRFDLIKADRDDNKFVDCAIAANATYIVSDDKHFKPLRSIGYPRLLVLRLMEFVERMK